MMCFAIFITLDVDVLCIPKIAYMTYRTKRVNLRTPFGMDDWKTRQCDGNAYEKPWYNKNIL
uniref:Uncharacterized protein n=1 Tax=Arundo donax TaxID=35708 RepID=A0A0A8Z305_ARUDO